MADSGKQAEREVAQLCGDLFLKDFVLASPMFRTQSGQLREAADALLPSGDTLLALQVKTRRVPGGTLSDNGPEVGRVRKRVEAAIEQVKTVNRALEAGSFETAKTIRGVDIPLSGRSFGRVVGIVVFDVVGDSGESLVNGIEVMSGFTFVHEIPVHVFRISDFREIAKEQDTLPDLLNYLNTRESLFASKTVAPFVSELDLFGLFKTRYPDIEDALSAEGRFLLVEPGLWRTVHDRFPEMWRQRDDRIRPSYLVDRTIEEVHTCIGYDPTSEYPEEIRRETSTVSSGGAEYWEIVQKLGRLSRIERVQFGEKMLEKARSADSKPFAFTLIYRYPDVGPIVYLCSNKPRHERVQLLHFLMKCACAHMDVSHAVGICTQAYSSAEHCHDFALIDGVYFTDPEAAKREAKKYFGIGKGTSLDEWGRDYAAEDS